MLAGTQTGRNKQARTSSKRTAAPWSAHVEFGSAKNFVPNPAETAMTAWRARISSLVATLLRDDALFGRGPYFFQGTRWAQPKEPAQPG